MKFQKFLYKLIHKEIRRKIFFPNSKISAINLDKKRNFGKKEFLNLSNEILRPFLRKNGFEGEKDIFIKEANNFYNRIVIAGSKHGKAFCINCEIKKKTFDEFKILDLESFPTEFDYWERISPDEQDSWWFTADSKEKNIKILNEMIKLLEFEGFPFFERNNKKIK